MLTAPGPVRCRHSVRCSTVTLAKVTTSPEMTRKLKILALHSFRTSGATFALQVHIDSGKHAYVAVALLPV